MAHTAKHLVLTLAAAALLTLPPCLASIRCT